MAVDSSLLTAGGIRPGQDPTRRILPASAGDLETMAECAGSILNDALAAALEPEQVKVLRKWNLREVSEWLQVSRRTLERGLEDGTLPQGERDASRRRVFTLEEMHKIQEVLGLRPWRSELERAVTVCIANFKGGSAKTSTSIHLSQYLALRGYRVLAVDLDAQGSLTTLFGLRPDADLPITHTAAPWFYGPGGNEANGDWTGTLATAIRPTHWHGLDLLGANLHLYGAEFALSARQANEPNFRFYRVLDEGLQTVRDRYDVIVIDTPPSLSFLASNALYAADGIVVPVPPALLDFASSVSFFQLLAELIRTFDRLEEKPKQFDFLGLLVSKYEANNPNHVAIHDWLRAAFSKQILLNTMSQTTILKLGADIKTAYEIDRYEGDRRTLTRALEHLNGVNGEIEAAVRTQWPSARAAAAVAKGNRARGAPPNG